MAPRNLKLEIQKEIQKVANSKFLKEFSKQLNGYEKRVRGLVRDFNLRGQEARKKSKRQVDQFTKRLKKTRREVEKTLKSLLNQESRLLNKSFNELVSHLKALSEQEKRSAAKSKSAKKKKTTKKRKKKGTAKSRIKTLKSIHENRDELPAKEPVLEVVPSPVESSEDTPPSGV